MPNGTVLIHSGGMDSTTLLYDLLDKDHRVRTLSINYGQRHRKELEAAAAISKQLGVEHFEADITAITPLLAGSSQTSEDVAVPEGHYAEESMKTTVVPNRNMIMLSIAIGWAVSVDADKVAYAAHAGDHAIYPDCRPEFAAALDKAANLCHFYPVDIIRPFIAITKADIVRVGNNLGVPYEMTWTCYQGLDIACGRCSTCVERLEAFDIANAVDPITYTDTKYWRGVIDANSNI